MNKRLLLLYLNWFYTLELEQVALYKEQARAAESEYKSEVFNHLARIENGHVKNIGESIKVLGAKPSRMGRIIGPVFGKPLGQLTTKLKDNYLFKINILLETKAANDYSNLIKRVNDEGLLKILTKNLIEEDLHRSWFIEQKRQLQE